MLIPEQSSKNVVYVATMNNTVSALDADDRPEPACGRELGPAIPGHARGLRAGPDGNRIQGSVIRRTSYDPTRAPIDREKRWVPEPSTANLS